MRSALHTLGLTAFALAAGPVLLAQTTTTGALNGRVTDTSGAPLAGATVRLTSGQIMRVLTTSADGHYSIGLLNAGSWNVAVSKAGYSTSRQVVSVAINATGTANFKMGKEGGSTVEVLGTVGTVDATSTTTGANYALDSLTAIPKGRDVSDVAFMTPGVASSGTFTGGIGLGISIAGASGADNSFSVDGLKTNDMRYGGQGVSMVNEFVDQVDVQTGGFKPEYSALGGVFNVLTKSGSNDFAGSSWITATPEGLKPGAKRNTYYSESKPSSSFDVGTLVSGAFIKDRFFYAVGLNYEHTQTPSQPNQSGDMMGKIKIPNTQYFGKLNFFINTDNQLTLSVFGNNKTTTTESAKATTLDVGDGRGTADRGNDTTANSSNISFIYDSNLASNLTLSVKVGQAKITNDVKPFDMTTPLVNDALYYWPDKANAEGLPPIGAGHTGAPAGTIYSSGGYGLWNHEKNTTQQATVDLTWVLGSHSLKFGVSTLRSKYELVEGTTGGARYSIAEYKGKPRLRARFISNESSVKAEFNGLYAQDTWQATKDLNIFFGFRAEQQKQKNADGKEFLRFDFGDYIQPRVGFTWDVLGNSKSKLSGSFAQYYENIPQRMAIREFSHEIFYEDRYYDDSGINTYAYDWKGANRIGTWSGTPKVVDYASGFTNPPIEDHIKLPKRTEYMLGFDQQLSATTTVGIHGRYRKLKNPLEDSVITTAAGDPVGDANMPAIIWNPRPGPISWITGPQDDQGTLKHVNVANTLFPEAYNEYKAVDLTYVRKTENNLISLSYTWSRLYGNYEGTISSSNGQADGNITASFDYYPYVGTGLLPLDRTHMFKAYGYQKVQLGADTLTLGLNFLAQSGIPYSYFDDGRSSTPKLEDIGAYGDAIPRNNKLGDGGRTPTQTRLDLNITYNMKLGGKKVLEPSLDIMNLMNSRPATSVQEQATDAGGTLFPPGKWASALTYQEGRGVRFGAKLRF